MNHPVLYSYRRCPYAMRARMAIYYSAVQVEQREIVFWDKPEPMLKASPKGTVPVLILPSGEVIDESRDIMVWALEQTQSFDWLCHQDNSLKRQIDVWIDRCDEQFKPFLDQYKYADRHPEFSAEHYREQGCVFLDQIEQQLQSYGLEKQAVKGLVNNQPSMADMATFTFIRQFANVDKNWFAEAPYPFLKHWLNDWLASEAFKAIMKNRPTWQPEHQPLWVDEPGLQSRNQFHDKAMAVNQV